MMHGCSDEVTHEVQEQAIAPSGGMLEEGGPHGSVGSEGERARADPGQAWPTWQVRSFASHQLREVALQSGTSMRQLACTLLAKAVTVTAAVCC